MHLIRKDPQATKEFLEWAKSQKLSNWSDFVNNHHERYTSLRDELAIMEQNCLSAYTEAPLGGKVHIDHFRKRSMYPKLMFVRHNLFVDDINDNYGACYKDQHAGVTKDTFDGDGRIFDPAVEDMAQYVTFNYRGEMLPCPGIDEKIYRRVERTIAVFSLNHEALRAKRHQLITTCTSYKDGGLTADDTCNELSYMGFPTCLKWAIENTFTD